jgi:hypothetical protein
MQSWYQSIGAGGGGEHAASEIVIELLTQHRDEGHPPIGVSPDRLELSPNYHQIGAKIPSRSEQLSSRGRFGGGGKSAT